MGHVTQVNSLQSVQIDRLPHQVKDLHPFVGSKPSSGHGSDSEESEQLVNLRSDALGEPDKSPDDGLSEDGMTSRDDSPNTSGQNAERLNDPLLIVCLKVKIPLWRSIWHKWPAPGCSLCDHVIRGECSKR